MGGAGSGRLNKTDRLLRDMKQPAKIVNTGEQLIIPNYSGISDFTHKQKPDIYGNIISGATLYGDGSNLTGVSGSDNLGNHIATQTISGAAISMTGNISGALIYGDGSNLTGLTAGAGMNNFYVDADSGTAQEITSGQTLYISGATAISTEAKATDSIEISVVQTELTHLTSLSGAHATTRAGQTALSGQHAATSGAVATNTTNISTNTSDITALSGQHSTTSSTASTNTAKITSLSGQHASTSGAVSINAGNITTNTNLNTSLSGSYFTHAADASDPHGAMLTQTNLNTTGTLSGAQIRTTGDNTTSGSSYVASVIFGTASGSHTASSYPQGSLMFIYS